ncbi:MAG: UDP-2,4-diacetamido-2,4,6-trideoxy-beta-L-altropyranose hydrolase [Candidatus Sulfotelmatobacter sp.]
MRCLALAHAWQDAGGRAVFAMAESTPAIQDRLAAESCEVIAVSGGVGGRDDSLQTIALAREQQADWIVVDGYRFTTEYQRALKAAELKVLFVDDYGHAGQYLADLLLNQNVSAAAEMYADREPQTRLLLGPRYCLLRREFAAWQQWDREVLPIGRRVLVMMGGSDPGNLTARVMGALNLARVQDLEATVVAGGSNPHFEELEKAASQSGQKITVKRDVTNMAELMAAADAAISAAGSTCWELCLLGLPALLLDVADNQTAIARELDRGGCAIHVGDRTAPVEKIAHHLEQLLHSRELRQSLSQRSRELVDGKGARRVVSVLRGTQSLWLRRARPEDAPLLWQWANDPEARAASFSSDPIPWESHVAWFAGKLGHRKSLILIAEDEEATACGQIRFDGTDGDWEVDVSIASAMRGRGLASELIGLGVRAIQKEDHVGRVHAFVKPANAASVRAFENANFKRKGTEKIRGNAAIHLVYEGN